MIKHLLLQGNKFKLIVLNKIKEIELSDESISKIIRGTTYMSQSTRICVLDYLDTFVVILKNDRVIDSYVVRDLAGVLEDNEDISIYTEQDETYGRSYGTIRISKETYEITEKNYDFISFMKGLDYGEDICE